MTITSWDKEYIYCLKIETTKYMSVKFNSKLPPTEKEEKEKPKKNQRKAFQRSCNLLIYS